MFQPESFMKNVLFLLFKPSITTQNTHLQTKIEQKFTYT